MAYGIWNTWELMKHLSGDYMHFTGRIPYIAKVPEAMYKELLDMRLSGNKALTYRDMEHGGSVWFAGLLTTPYDGKEIIVSEVYYYE